MPLSIIVGQCDYLRALIGTYRVIDVCMLLDYIKKHKLHIIFYPILLIILSYIINLFFNILNLYTFAINLKFIVTIQQGNISGNI